jgi:uncharacterized protein (TIGR02444 family)
MRVNLSRRRACSLQDAHGQNVPWLLWAAWMAGEGRTADLKDAAKLMRAWDVEVGAPLRGVRRALKLARPPVDDAAKEALRDAVKAVELKGERVLMESLEALSGPGRRADPSPGRPCRRRARHPATRRAGRRWKSWRCP